MGHRPVSTVSAAICYGRVMKRIFAIRSLLASAALCAIAASVTAAAPAPAPKAVPDFSGMWARSPDNYFFPVPGENFVPLVKLTVTGPNADPLVKKPVSDTDAEEIMAGDYHNSILQPWAREVVRKNAEQEIALDHVYTASNSCWPSGLPQILNLRDPAKIIQTKDKILFIHQRDHQWRTIYLNQPHSKNPKPSWYGESVGYWEGDTLVVDTIGQVTHALHVVDPWGTPHTEKLHVVERYRLINDADGKAIEIVFTVDDPGTFTAPWTAVAMVRPNRVQDILEVACAENNRHFEAGTTFGPMPEEKTPAF